MRETNQKEYLTKKCLCCDNNRLELYSPNSCLGFPISFCSNCGIYSLFGDEEKIKTRTNDVYNKNYWDDRKAEEAIESNYKNLDSLELKVRWKSEKEFCEPFISKTKTILEIGSGRGQNLYFFSNTLTFPSSF